MSRYAWFLMLLAWLLLLALTGCTPLKKGVNAMKPTTVTAHFATLRKAVHEAHKYGAPHTYEAARQQITLTGTYTHDITHDRQLAITRQASGAWKLSVQVAGRVVPARQMPALMIGLINHPQFG